MNKKKMMMMMSRYPAASRYKQLLPWDFDPFEERVLHLLRTSPRDVFFVHGLFPLLSEERGVLSRETIVIVIHITEQQPFEFFIFFSNAIS